MVDTALAEAQGILDAEGLIETDIAA